MFSRFAQHIKAVSYKWINKKIRKCPSPLKDKWPNCVSRSCHKISLVPWIRLASQSWIFFDHLISADAKLLPQSVIHGAKGLLELLHHGLHFLRVALRIVTLVLCCGCALLCPLIMVLFFSPWLWPCILLRECTASSAPDEGNPELRQCVLLWWGHPLLTNGYSLHTH